MCLILRLLDVQVIRGCRLCQTARHQEVAAVALADLDQLALFALALNVGLENYFHGDYSFCVCYIECGEQLRLLFGFIYYRPAFRSADRRSSREWHP